MALNEIPKFQQDEDFVLSSIVLHRTGRDLETGLAGVEIRRDFRKSDKTYRPYKTYKAYK